MHVAEEENVTALQRALHHQLGVVVDRVELARGTDPLTVQILAHQRTSVVSNDDTIGVEHGHNLEDECAPEELRLVIVAHQKVNHAIHHVRGIGLARVHPRREDD